MSPIEPLWIKSLFMQGRAEIKILFMKTCSAVFFVYFAKYPKIDSKDKKHSRLFLEFSFFLATQTISKSGEDVSQIIEPVWFIEKSAVKTDI